MMIRMNKGRAVYVKGVKHGRAKLTEAQVAEIKERYAGWWN